jgi:hypothetical protein
MTSKEMHYDLKQKLNKIDSQKYRNLYVPEIDWKLNEAQEVFVKIIAQPRYGKQIGFELNQRTINDIRTIVVDQIPATGIVPTVFDSSSFMATLPADFWFLAKAYALGTKGTCIDKVLKLREVQHDDEHELSPFDRSSFIWRVSNMRFNDQGIRVFTDGTYSITKVILEYLKEPRRIHNAADWPGGTYTTLDGVVLTGTQDCILPKPVHREIVDLAVLIISGNLNMPDRQAKKEGVELTQ